MFGKQPQKLNLPTPQRPRAADVAKIQGGGLVQLIVTTFSPLSFYLFLNDKYVSQMDVESLNVSVEEPTQNNPTGTNFATLAYYIPTVTGERTLQRQSLFPCTLEIVAMGRRLSMTAMNPDSLEGLWIDLGLKPDGSGSEVTGVRSLRVLITDGIVDAKITWDDGETEDLLPQA